MILLEVDNPLYAFARDAIRALAEAEEGRQFTYRLTPAFRSGTRRPPAYRLPTR